VHPNAGTFESCRRPHCEYALSHHARAVHFLTLSVPVILRSKHNLPKIMWSYAPGDASLVVARSILDAAVLGTRWDTHQHTAAPPHHRACQLFSGFPSGRSANAHTVILHVLRKHPHVPSTPHRGANPQPVAHQRDQCVPGEAEGPPRIPARTRTPGEAACRFSTTRVRIRKPQSWTSARMTPWTG
jgi:hypothetical protein